MKRGRVLIVDDEIDLLDLLDFNLTRAGFATATAFDGDDGLAKVASFKPELIILDLMLPKINGWEFSRRLRESGDQTPVIMLTAKCMPEDKVKGFECGATIYMTKPFSVKELIDKVSTLFYIDRLSIVCGEDAQKLLGKSAEL